MRIEQKSNGKGSLKDIQLLVNNKENLINKEIKNAFKELTIDTVIWQSPLQSDNFAEYRDNDFIKKHGLNTRKIDIHSFWPRMGPQWDALATTKNDNIILV